MTEIKLHSRYGNRIWFVTYSSINYTEYLFKKLVLNSSGRGRGSLSVCCACGVSSSSYNFSMIWWQNRWCCVSPLFWILLALNFSLICFLHVIGSAQFVILRRRVILNILCQEMAVLLDWGWRGGTGQGRKRRMNFHRWLWPSAPSNGVRDWDKVRVSGTVRYSFLTDTSVMMEKLDSLHTFVTVFTFLTIIWHSFWLLEAMNWIQLLQPESLS